MYDDFFVSDYDIAAIIPQNLSECHQMNQTWTPLQWGLEIHQSTVTRNKRMQVKMDLAMFGEYLAEVGNSTLATVVSNMIQYPKF